MTESQNNTPNVATNAPLPPASNPKSSKSNAFILVLLILLLLLCSGAGIYFWQAMKQQNTVVQHLSQQKQSQAERINKLERSVGNKVSQLELFAQSTHEKLTAIDRQALFNTQQLNELGASNRADWLLAEIEYLLHLANQRLNLEKDFKGSEAILTAADKVIAELNDPGLLPIRESIRKEIFQLQQINLVDQEGLYLELSTLIASLDELEADVYLKTKAAIKANDNNSAVDRAELSLWETIWNDLKSVVKIKSIDQANAPLLAPEQSYYLKQNLRLMLEQASVALLERNQTIYENSLDKAHTWLHAYFDIESPLLNSIIAKVNTLKTIKIDYALPDISQSLRLTKKKIEAMYRSHSLGQLNSPNDEKLIQEGSGQ